MNIKFLFCFHSNPQPKQMLFVKNYFLSSKSPSYPICANPAVNRGIIILPVNLGSEELAQLEQMGQEIRLKQKTDKGKGCSHTDVITIVTAQLIQTSSWG